MLIEIKRIEICECIEIFLCHYLPYFGYEIYVIFYYSCMKGPKISLPLNPQLSSQQVNNKYLEL